MVQITLTYWYSKEVSRTIKPQDSGFSSENSGLFQPTAAWALQSWVSWPRKREHSSHPKGETGAQLAVGSKASGYVSVDFKDHHICPIGQQESLSLQTGRMTDGQCWPDSGQASWYSQPYPVPSGSRQVSASAGNPREKAVVMG